MLINQLRVVPRKLSLRLFDPLILLLVTSWWPKTFPYIVFNNNVDIALNVTIDVLV
jgi:hypothetical protein